jgi:tRNA-splicing ligase RtcB
MEILKGKNVPIKLWANVHEVESQALTQLKNIAALPWCFNHIAVMPDVHLGKGATVGSVIAMKDAVSPSAVGVDIGCVDAETEFLTPIGWKRISEYVEGDEVLQYDPETEQASFVRPQRYIAEPYDGIFYHLKTKYGIDQMLTPEHRVLYYKPGRDRSFRQFDVLTAEEVVKQHRKNVLGFKGGFKGWFTKLQAHGTALKLTNPEIRVMVMVMADGSFDARRGDRTCTLHLKKERKIERAEYLLQHAGIDYKKSRREDSTVNITFDAPWREKSMYAFWPACPLQLRVIAEEVFNWDGNYAEKCFYTRDKASADFMHYAFAALGKRSVMRQDAHSRDGELDYRVYSHGEGLGLPALAGTPKCEIEEVIAADGKKYCFTVPTGFWLMRRGGNIVITGNCGMLAAKTSLTASRLPDNLGEIRSRIEQEIPSGFHARAKAHPELKRSHTQLFDRFNGLHEKVKDLEGRALLQCGTLGGGNHFIEICLDTEDNVWVMLHSGSRNIGKTLAEIHISIAKRLTHNNELPDRELSVFLAGTPEMQAYRNDLMWAQEYAWVNRQIMFAALVDVLREFWPGMKHEDPVACHHNYVAEEIHFGEKVFVTRKGAINAEAGRMGIIPGSMGTCSTRSSNVNLRLASLRDILRPAPCEAELKASGLPLPRTMYEHVPIEPGMMPMRPASALIAPFLVTKTFSPKWISSAT